MVDKYFLKFILLSRTQRWKECGVELEGLFDLFVLTVVEWFYACDMSACGARIGPISMIYTNALLYAGVDTHYTHIWGRAHLRRVVVAYKWTHRTMFDTLVFSISGTSVINNRNI